MKSSAFPRACATLIVAGLTAGGSAALAAERDRIALTGVEWTGEPSGGIGIVDDTDDPDTAIRTLTTPPEGAIDYWPSWSPSGNQLVFLRFDFMGPAIYRVDVDGSNLTRLVGGAEVDSFGNTTLWGPRSTNLIAFVNHNDSCAYVMSPDGSNQRKVLCSQGYGGVEVRQWFPDGRHLLVGTRSSDDSAELHRVEVATGGARSLGTFASRPSRVSISPGGGQIALDDANNTIQILDVATGTRRLLTTGMSPVFSADGGRIAFRKKVESGAEPLFVIDADGSNARRITPDRPDGRYSAYTPIEWSVDGSEVVVQAAIDTGDDFYSYPSGIIRLDDGSFRRGLSSARVNVLGYPNPWFEEEDAAIALTNCVTRQNLIGGQGDEKLYKLIVPTGARKLAIAASGGTGDVSLYASQGNAPAPDDAQYWSAHGGTNNEAIRIAPAAAGTYYVKVVGAQAYGGVNLRACFAP